MTVIQKDRGFLQGPQSNTSTWKSTARPHHAGTSLLHARRSKPALLRAPLHCKVTEGRLHEHYVRHGSGVRFVTIVLSDKAHLDAAQRAVAAEEVGQVALAGADDVKVDDEQGGGGRRLLAPLLLPPLDVAVALREEGAQKSPFSSRF